MVEVIGVRFRKAGKIYYFDPDGHEVELHHHVIVETIRGVEYGSVVIGRRMVEDNQIVAPLKKIIRIATPEDDAQERDNKVKERDALALCEEKVKKHNLPMKLVDVEYTFDNNKLLFYFTADGRVDFRELVKDLASVFKTRIELRQIGVRDETKMIGGIGICGRPLCCNSHLSEFHPVSIKMAKDQSLSLNPTKISGVCGRLMCCLKHEEETYEWLNSKLPIVGSKVKTPTGKTADVLSVRALRQKVKVLVRMDSGENEIVEYHTDELVFEKTVKDAKMELSREELAELKRLEHMEKKEGGMTIE